MTRESIFNSCLYQLGISHRLLMELPTGFGKSKLAIDLINHVCDTELRGKSTSMLLVVAKIVHKQTWKDEIEKWGGLKVTNLEIECYESLRKHSGKKYDFILFDEVHHVGSDIRLELLYTISFDYLLGLSATIPEDLENYMQSIFKTEIVSCDLVEAIEEEILPEPQIVLFPLKLDNTKRVEKLELNPKSYKTVMVTYDEFPKYRASRNHIITYCTQEEKNYELGEVIEIKKNLFMKQGTEILKHAWLHLCGKRLEYLADCKLPIVLDILKKLENERTITFCKTIQQTEILGHNCIHSKNKKATEYYERFNKKEINHITAVNILNENANLVDCKYAIFTNITASEIMSCQRLGRSLRHKSPVIIVPYYKGTREEDLVDKMFEDYDQKYFRYIKSVEEL